MSASKPSLLDTALQSIISELAKGTAPWRRPWRGSRPTFPRRVNGEAYSGMNAILLSTIQMTQGYGSSFWLTFNQALALGGSVRKGERGSPAVLYKTRLVEGEGADSGDPDKVLRFLKAYAVFNAEQIDDLPPAFLPEAAAALCDDEPAVLSPAVAAILRNFPTPVKSGGDRACYFPEADRIQMPPLSAFDSDEDYVATLLHEFAHATGHRSRLDRFIVGGSREDYAREELVAELASHLVSLHLGLPPSEAVFQNHVAYLGVWAGLLRDQPGELLKAAGKAQAACDVILSFGANAGSAALSVVPPVQLSCGTGFGCGS